MDAYQLEQIYQLEGRKKAILGKLKTNMPENELIELLREYNEINDIIKIK